MRNRYFKPVGRAKKKTYKLNPKVHNYIYTFKSDNPDFFRSKSKVCGYCGKPIYIGQKCWFEGAGGFYCNNKHWKAYWRFVKSSKSDWVQSAKLNSKPKEIPDMDGLVRGCV